MPNKDPERRKEVVRNAVRRYRERKKKEQELMKVSKCDSGLRFELPENINPEKKAEFIVLLANAQAIIDTSTDSERKALRDALRNLMHEDDAKQGFKAVLEFIPNMLSLGIDLQMLKHRGGTA